MVADQLFGRDEFPWTVAAPMVRYSRLPFRTLVRKYGCQLCFTPMIIAKSFSESEKAREADFSTNQFDKPVMVQFAANNAVYLASAAEIVAPLVSGVDLNCGCPQRWAMAEGYGSSLISQPELVADMIRHVRNRISDPNFALSIKIRIREDDRDTVELCRQAEAAGCTFLTVHARTPTERHQPIHSDVLRIVKDSVDIPVIANGSVFSLADARKLKEETGVDGIMAARGLLENPALFDGFDRTPDQCVRDWIEICTELQPKFDQFHRLTMWMLEGRLTKADKVVFSNFRTCAQVYEFLEARLGFDLSFAMERLST